MRGGRGRLVLATAVVVLLRVVAAAAPLRVASFNMLHGGLTSALGGDGERLEDRLRLASADLAGLDLDVLGLQEASVARDRGDMAARLAAALGMPAVVGAPPLTWFDRLTAAVLRLSEGPALVSRHPLIASRVWPLPRCGDSSARSLVCGEVAAPGATVTVCSTHIDGGACQLAALAQRIAARCPTTPLVVLGDLNATQHAPAVVQLLAVTGLRDTFRTAHPDEPGATVWQPVTSERSTVHRRIDYVFVAPGGGVDFDVRDSRVVLDRPHATPAGPLWPSDHRAVLAELAPVPAPAPASPPHCVRLGGV
ncbi:MAG: endonuclease/exonuclease/phosphatase family protein [bacterium]|nr:endonuclease/exonuclease/phosphatase family protein [bacterium]